MLVKTPQQFGKGHFTLFWDILWSISDGEAAHVDLLDHNSYFLPKDLPPVIPATKEDPLLIHEIDENTGTLKDCNNIKYTIHLLETESQYDGVIIRYTLRVERGQKSKVVHYFRYPTW